MHLSLAHMLIVFASLLLVVLTTGLRAVQPTSSPVDKRSKFSITEGTRLPVGRGGHSAGMVGGHLVVVGGNHWTEDRKEKIWHADSLIFQDDRWIAGPSLPHAVAYAATAQVDSQLILAGGNEGTHMVTSAYALSWDGELRISPLPALPIAYDAAGAAAVGRTVYLFGGETPNGLLKKVFKLDLDHVKAGWKECADLPGQPRALVATHVQDSRIFVIGGVSSWKPLTAHHDVCCFDTKHDRWVQMPNLEMSGYAWAAAPVDASHFLLAGRANGEISDGIWLVRLPDLSVRQVGHSPTPTTTAPLVQTSAHEWWLIGGEPDSNKNRTPIVTRITSQHTSE